MKQYFNKVLLLIFPIFLLQTYVNAQVLNFYYGNLHAHSIYSDGNKDSATSHLSTPYDDFQFAKTALNFNFLGISEHNHNNAGLEKINYAKGLQQSDSANQDGIFIAMYGMEWGVIGPPGGHVLIYGVNQLIGWDTVGGLPNYDIYNAKLDYNGLFTKIARTTGAFASFAHPASTDYGNLFASSVNLTYDSAIRGCAIRSGPAFSTDTSYSNSSTSSFEIRYKDALKRGYHLGALLDHDNHYTTFGKTAASRTVVLAPTLTRADLLDAIRNRRTQASDDWNVRVTFTINGNPLGSIFSDTANPQIAVTVFDPDLETTSSIAITYGIPGSGIAPTTLTSSSTGSLSYTHTIANGASYYYYAVITQADGDKIFTAPIWIDKASVLPVKLISFIATKSKDNIEVKWQTASEKDADYFELERSNDGLTFTSIHQQKATNSNKLTQYIWLDKNYPSSVIYYRLKQVDADGTINYSNIILVSDLKFGEPKITVTPNPFDDNVVLGFDNILETRFIISCYDWLGETIFVRDITNLDYQDYLLNMPKSLNSGMYTLHIQSEERSFVKHILKLEN